MKRTSKGKIARKQLKEYRSSQMERTNGENKKGQLPEKVNNVEGSHKLSDKHIHGKASENFTHEWNQCEAVKIIVFDDKIPSR